MARLKSDNVLQINISIPSEWKRTWKTLQVSIPVEEGETITFLDLHAWRYSGKISVRRKECE